MPDQQPDLQEFTDAVKPFTDFLSKNFPKGICVSDIRDIFGRQYVDLAQEGGGIHGIALAGYTYILEKMGVRFMKMAGTSAGSINTLLLNAVYTNEEADELRKRGSKIVKDVKYYETRSEKVLEYLAKKDLREMIDGHQLWRTIFLNLFAPKSSGEYLKSKFYFYKKLIIILGITLSTLLVSSVASAIYPVENGLRLAFVLITILSAVSVATILAWLFSRLLIGRLMYRFAEFLGINPGDNFETWITNILVENGIENTEDLNKKFTEESDVFNPQYNPCDPIIPKEGLTHSPVQSTANMDEIIEKVKTEPNVENLISELRSVLFPDKSLEETDAEHKLDLIMNAFEVRLRQEKSITRELVIVSSDITHEIKVEFPGMHKMYWGNDYQTVSPAKYVRASMSVPIFYKPFQVNFVEGQMETIREEWNKIMKTGAGPKDQAIFVDGGLLSNFPINVFYNPDLPVPRKPTFGIRLEYQEDYQSTRINDIMGLAGSLISTMRFFYDREFALKHDLYKKTVRSVDTGKIHWLNFYLHEQNKIELFFRGALSATIFLAHHAITDEEVEKLINEGNHVAFRKGTFSIYDNQKKNDFRTEDKLKANLVFEWQSYKKERLKNRIYNEDLKDNIKTQASMKNLPSK
ncbi:MAG: hypothetical protein C5B52_08455 [Bacteroidetes bacterium]|nr:MAG: hypothetical protein C5B52_08455 [Bacteroidota bacterium]